MIFDLATILQSKRDFRQRLAARPIAEKLALLDALRERALAIRPTRRVPDAGALHEDPLRWAGKENRMTARRKGVNERGCLAPELDLRADCNTPLPQNGSTTVKQNEHNI